MLRKNIKRLLKLTILLVLVTPVHADISPATILNTGAEPEGITLNPITGNYTIVYESLTTSGKPMLFKTVYEPPTKISPKLFAEITVQGEMVNYEFTMESANDSQQKIVSAQIYIDDDIILDASIGSPNGWTGMFVENSSNSVGWFLVSNDLSLSIQPNSSLSNFRFSSRKLPGVVLVKLRGNATILGLTGEGPRGDLGQQLNSIINKDFVSVYSSGPVIANPVPYNSVTVLNNMKLHLRELANLRHITESLYIDAAQVIDATINSVNIKDNKSTMQFLYELSTLIGLNSKVKNKEEDKDRDNDEEDDKEDKDRDNNNNKDRSKSTGIAIEISDALIRSTQFNIDYIKSRL